MRQVTTIILLFLVPVLSMARALLPMGNYADPRSGEWTLGLFGEYAVWRGQAWDCRSVRSYDGGWAVVLRSEEGQAELRLAQPDDTTLVVRTDSGRTLALHRVRDGLCPLAPVKDESPFAVGARSADSATLSGCYAGAAGITVRLVCSWLNSHGVEWRTTTDSLGRFRFRLQTDVPLYARLIGGGQVVPVIILPGEVLYCHSDRRDGRDIRLAMGAAARLVNELWHFGSLVQFYIGYEESCNLSDADFLQRLDSCYTSEVRRLGAFEESHSTLSQQFRLLCREALRFATLSQAMQRRFVKRRTPNPVLPASLMARVESLMVAPPSVPLGLVDDVTPFLTDFIDYHNDLCNHTVAGTIHFRYLRQAFDEQKGVVLPDSAHQLLDRAVRIADTLHHVAQPDSALQRRYDLLAKQLADLLTAPALTAVQMDVWKSMNYRAQRDVLDGLALNPALRDYGAALLACAMMEQDHTPLPPALRDEALGAITSSTLRRHVESLDSQYAAAVTAHVDTSLLPNDSLEGLTDGRAILDRLLAPYRGSVVYVDVWGSWCGPCKHDMRYWAPAIKKRFQGQPVVFLYLANRTSIASWRSIIQEYGCCGPQVVHYNLPAAQQDAVERVLGVAGYPHYSLVGPDGRLEAANAPRPYEVEKLTNAIQKLITISK